MSIEEMVNSERVLNDLGIWQKEVLAMVMQDYAEQQAILFANFVGNRPLPEYSISQNRWRWWNNDKREYEFASTEQLYELFNKQK